MRAAAHRTPLAEINVTPLVDVTLVLLIIFMVAAPLLEPQGINVVLPKARTGGRLTSSTVSITLTKEHLVYFNDEVVTMKELRHQLAKLPHGQPILIRADRNAYVNRLVELWDLCRDLGFQEIHIATLTE